MLGGKELAGGKIPAAFPFQCTACTVREARAFPLVPWKRPARRTAVRQEKSLLAAAARVCPKAAVVGNFFTHYKAGENDDVEQSAFREPALRNQQRRKLWQGIEKDAEG